MNMLTLLSFVGLVAFSSASKCCAPPQFERDDYIDGTEVVGGKMSPVRIVKRLEWHPQMNSTSEFTVSFVSAPEASMHLQGTARTAYDATNQMVMTKSSVVHGEKKVTKQVLSDYKNGYEYMVLDGTCTKTKLTGPFPAACIPDNASGGTVMYFGLGDNKIMVTNYMVQDQDMWSSLLVTDKCVPFSNTTTFTGGQTPYVISVGYNGTTLGIKDPSVFDIPPSCPHEHKTKDVQKSSKKSSKPCCVPKQFESPGGIIGLIDVNGKSLKQGITINVSADAINKKTMTKSVSYVENYPPTVIIELKDYADGWYYRVMNGVCTKYKLTTEYPFECMPANASVTPIVMGVGEHALKGRLYEDLEIQGIKMTMMMTDDCVPISQSMNGFSGANMEYWYSMGYSALTTGIKDPSVFDIPPGCKQDENPSNPIVEFS